MDLDELGHQPNLYNHSNASSIPLKKRDMRKDLKVMRRL
jgi:hypothetical protein